MSEIDSFLAACQHQSILIVGDLMLDRYLWGNVNRISPEAPVPIIDITKEENRLGGAANVALNLHALGARPLLCGLVGQDADGHLLQSMAEQHGFSTDLIQPSSARRTTVKVRIIGQQQQMLRVDKEDRLALTPQEEQALLQALEPRLSAVSAIVFQDYDKGLLSPSFIARITSWARKRHIPMAVDPKFEHFFDFSHCQLFKPNMKELNEGMGTQLDKTDFAGIRETVRALRARMPHAATLVTLSEHGMLLLDESLAFQHFPAHFRKITDVSGAGDTVISLMALGLGTSTPLAEAAAYANLAGGLVCEDVGVVPIDRDRLRKEALQLQHRPEKVSQEKSNRRN